MLLGLGGGLNLRLNIHLGEKTYGVRAIYMTAP
jgi:hypothetical protein